MESERCQFLVVGAGPGGYVAAIRAGQLGVDTILVEKAAPGGTCLNVGCIPSKALIHAADAFEAARHAAGASALGIRAGAPQIDLVQTVAWKDGIVGRLTGGVGALFKKAKVRRLTGAATFEDGKTVRVAGPDGERRVHAGTVLIAVGSEPAALPGLPFGGDILSSTEALSLTSVPERLAVVGAGYIGLEIGMAYAKLGAAVTVVEAAGRILPAWDAELTRPVAKRLEALGVTVLTGARAEGFADGVLTVAGPEGAVAVPADKVLVAVGRKPCTEGWGRENLALDMDGPFIRIDETCRTAMRGVYAVGDVTGEPMLAHRAMAQGEMVAEIVAGRRRAWDRRAIPAVCFTDPEIVAVGLSPEAAGEAADEAGGEAAVSRFPFAANGRAMTVEGEDGFIRIVSRKRDGLVLGVQAVGRGVSELSAAFGLALEMGATLDDVAATIHAHPTLGEAFQEAALGGLGHALHI